MKQRSPTRCHHPKMATTRLLPPCYCGFFNATQIFYKRAILFMLNFAFENLAHQLPNAARKPVFNLLKTATHIHEFDLYLFCNHTKKVIL